MGKMNIGTCSWKYDSWKGVIYPEKDQINYLQEYSRHYGTVEVDQWFWSLFPGNKSVLPLADTVHEYKNSVPEDFQFVIKVPNSITLTHFYKKKKSDPLIKNPHYLSRELMEQFLRKIEPLSANLGPLMFQFEYLNRKKMPGGVKQFVEEMGAFIAKLPQELAYGIEVRNPNFLQPVYFNFLRSLGVAHVFLHGYYMPSVFDIYRKYEKLFKTRVIIRLHGPDRKEIEAQTGKNWSHRIAPKDKDLVSLVEMLSKLQSHNMESFVFVNNHFEGSAPRTIERIYQLSEQ